MSVKIVNETTQEFNGQRYWLCGYYFQRKGSRLHRVVWEYHNGPIPAGYHVHHIDEDRANNSIDNLELVHGSRHVSFHSGKADHSKAIKAAQEKAREWHASEAGRQWHRENWEKNSKPVLFERVEKTCEVCGKSYQGLKRKRTKYCHANCKARALRQRRADEKRRRLLLER